MLHIYIELSSTATACDIILRVLATKHQCGGRVWFFKKGVLDGYIFDNKVARFTFCDELLLGKLENRVLQVVEPENLDVPIELTDENDDGSICDACFPAESLTDHDPLDYERFDVFREWVLDVTLKMEVFLEHFVNPRTK